MWRAHLLAILACGVTTLVSIPMHDWLEPVNAVMLFLLTVVLVAAWLGRGPAILASFLSVGLFDFFHVPPRWSFAVSDVQYLLTFAVMLVVALLISQLTIRLRVRAHEAHLAADRSRALYALASQLAGALTLEQVCEATSRFARQQLGAQATLWVPDAQTPEHLLPALPGQAPLSPTVALMAQAAHLGVQGAQGAAPASPPHVAQHSDEAGLRHMALPLMGSTRSRGVLMLALPAHLQVPPAQRELLDALATLVATSLERLHFVQVAHATQLEINDERLRASILSALSHDIRTPLTSLYGLADSLTLMALPSAASDMAGDIRDQAMRLHRMVSNLLDMARLQSGRQSGQLRLRLEWQPLEEVIGASIQMLGHALHAHPVKVHQPADLPMVLIDAVLMERVFGNLLENAAKYAPQGSEVHITLSRLSDTLEVRVRNAGAGFPADRLPHIFEVFERGQPESSIPGMGLGLSICQAIVQAHGGQIRAHNRPEGGAEVVFTLPLGSPPTLGPEADELPATEAHP